MNNKDFPDTDSLLDEIIETIRINRISTTEIADVLGKTGLIDIRIKPLTANKFIVGRIWYVPAFNGSNWYTHFYLQTIPRHYIAFVEPVNCGEKAVFGELVAKYTILYRQAAGMVVAGYVRDIPDLLKEQYPIWCIGGTPIGCINKDTGFDQDYFDRRTSEFKNSILVADDSGCVLIPSGKISESFLSDLHRIEQQEDLWFDSIDRLKYSTFETVCLRKYEQK